MKRKLIACGAATALIAVAVLVAQSERSDPGAPPSAGAIPGGVFLSTYGTVVSPEVAVYRADAGIRGRIESIGTARWSTVDGRKPVASIQGQPEVIYRVATVRVEETFLGEAAPVLKVALLGGEADGGKLSVESSNPAFAAGDSVVLFLVKPGVGWRLDADALGLLQGFVTKGDVASAPDVTTTVSSLVARTRAEAARKTSGAIEPAARP